MATDYNDDDWWCNSSKDGYDCGSYIFVAPSKAWTLDRIASRDRAIKHAVNIDFEKRKKNGKKRGRKRNKQMESSKDCSNSKPPSTNPWAPINSEETENWYIRWEKRGGEWAKRVWRRKPAVPPLPPPPPPPPLPFPHRTTSLSSSTISSTAPLPLPLLPLLRLRVTHTSSCTLCSFPRPTSSDLLLAFCRLGKGSLPSNPPPAEVVSIFSLQVVPTRRHPRLEPARMRPMTTTVKARYEVSFNFYMNKKSLFFCHPEGKIIWSEWVSKSFEITTLYPLKISLSCRISIGKRGCRCKPLILTSFCYLNSMLSVNQISCENEVFLGLNLELCSVGLSEKCGMRYEDLESYFLIFHNLTGLIKVRPLKWAYDYEQFSF